MNSKIGKNFFIQLFHNLLHSYSMLLFMRSKWLGFVLFGTTLFNPNLALSGIISWITTLLFARMIGIYPQNLVHSIYTYNSLIVGFSIGFIFKISFLSILMTIGTSVLTVMLSYTLFSLLSRQMKLPVLNIPFFFVSTIIYLASVKYSSLFVDLFYSFEGFNFQNIPLFIQGLLRTIGNLVFMPYDIPGLIILTAIFVASQIVFCLIIVSYYTGICYLALLKGSFPNAYYNFSAFNFILIGIALGSVFLIPSRRSYIIAITGVFVSVFILDAASVVWSYFRIPVFTLPFNVTVLLFIYVLRDIGFPYMNDYVQDSPEQSLDFYLNYSLRFDRITPQPQLPFMGTWTVYQSFDDEWTHQGNWKYAYDFVITDDDNQTYRNQGIELTDYYCYGKPVLCPIEGTVVNVVNSLKDLPIGSVDKHHNWGNYVIIYSVFGYYVELSHFQEKSIKVNIGDAVKPGILLGNCGNTGYSPQPHIHMQIQYWPQIGSATTYYYFSNCINQNRRLCGNMILSKNMKVDSLTFSRKRYQTLNFILEDSFLYAFSINNQDIKTIRITVKMDIDGSYFFHIDGTEDRLYFGIELQRFVFYRFDGKKNSPLRYLFATLPVMPITIDHINWHAILPGNIIGKMHPFRSFLQSFNHQFNNVQAEYKFSENNQSVEGTICVNRNQLTGKISFHDIKGFKEIQLNTPKKKYLLTLIDEPNEN